MRTRRPLVPILALLLAAAAPARVRAQHDPLAQAEQAFDALDFDRAAHELDRALAAGGASPTELVQIHLLYGVIEGASDHAHAAEAHFRIVLAIDPAARLPIDRVGSSRKWNDPFADATRHVSAHGGFALAAAAGDEPGAVVVTVTDPADAAVDVELRARDASGALGDPIVHPLASGSARFALAGATAVDLVLALRDGHGNHLAERGRAAAPIHLELHAAAAAATVAAPPPPPSPTPTPTWVATPTVAVALDRPIAPIYGRWWAWAGLAGAAGLVGARYALSDRAASLGDKDALRGEIAFAVAGGCAAIAIVLGLRDAAHDDGPIVSPTVAPGEVGVASSFRF